MPIIVFIGRDGRKIAVDAPLGQSIMQAALDNMVPGIVGECGGCVSCGSCEAVIDPVWQHRLPPRGADECALLGDTLLARPDTRLTCQLNVSESIDGIVVRLP